MGAPDRPELAAELTNSFCRTDPEIARHFARVTFLSDHRADLPLARTPALILQCTDDLIAPVEVGQYMQRAMPGSVLAMIENTGHCPHLSAPDASVAAIRAFMGRAG
jgi:sigma-B regulation protein RsbQ